MEERIRPTKSGLFAIELLIAVGVFTLCAAVCVGIFVRAEIMSRDSADLTRAVNEAKNVAECFKAAGGDPEKTAELCGGAVEQGAVRLTRGDFVIQLIPTDLEGYSEGELTVSVGDETLFSWTVAALPEAAS